MQKILLVLCLLTSQTFSLLSEPLKSLQGFLNVPFETTPERFETLLLGEPAKARILSKDVPQNYDDGVIFRTNGTFAGRPDTSIDWQFYKKQFFCSDVLVSGPASGVSPTQDAWKSMYDLLVEKYGNPNISDAMPEMFGRNKFDTNPPILNLPLIVKLQYASSWYFDKNRVIVLEVEQFGSIHLIYLDAEIGKLVVDAIHRKSIGDL